MTATDAVDGFIEVARAVEQRRKIGRGAGEKAIGIFDAFADEAGRQAHLSGKIAAALMAKAGELFSTPPVIEKVDLLAAKLKE